MIRPLLVLLAAVAAAAGALAYPLDAWEKTGIDRLQAYDRARDALLARGTLVPGSLVPARQVFPRLLEHPELEVPAADRELSARLREAVGAKAPHYGVALLDVTDPDAPLYAELNGRSPQSPGSVGKIVVGLAIFQALADVHPDYRDRRRLLRETELDADEVIQVDHHEVPFWRPGEPRVRKRPVEIGDRANLWTWLDWMFSASSNAAASALMQELVLLRHFGKDYPPAPEAREGFLRDTPKARLGAILRDAIDGALERNGLDKGRLRQGSLFTREGKARIPGAGSVATPRELLTYLLRMEQGRLVDVWTSMELKRLLYLTDRRIRYASHPALDDSAVYFKSGSLYSCRPEPGFVCDKYKGNRLNYMNSVALVETERGEEEPPLRYLVAVLSNVLRENSVDAHQALAAEVHRMVASRHAEAPGTTAAH